MTRYEVVMQSLLENRALEPILKCVISHPNAKDVATCTVLLTKEIFSRRRDDKRNGN